MLRVSARSSRALAGLSLVLALAACGKKAPLRLPENRPAERAPTVRARVREGRVILDFRVPRHRLFPERQEPWVLARILRQQAAGTESVEVGAILEAGGFAFDSPLTWSDQLLPLKSSFIYRVEFRDAARRRAIADPVTVSWDQVPDAPSALTVSGGAGAIALAWTAPGTAVEGLRYRVYRRAVPEPVPESLAPATVTESRFVDSRIETGRDYCYSIRAVLDSQGLDIEGPACSESCARAATMEPPPAQPPGMAPSITP